MRIHVVRHLPAIKNAEVEKAFGATKGGALRPLDTVKAAKLAPVFRASLAYGNPHFMLLGHSPTIRTAATLLITTVDMANGAPVVEIPEMYWTDETIAGIMPDFATHNINIAKWSPEGLAALDRLGKTGADGIRQALAKAGIDDFAYGDSFFVGHGPLTLSTAYHLAGNTEKAKTFCLGCPAGEGSRFVINYLPVGPRVSFVPLEIATLA